MTVTTDFYKVADDLAARIYDDLVQDMCVAFIGAGSTTERSDPKYGFFERIRCKSEHPEDNQPSFPELMQFFCTNKDGGHKNRLIREAISYIENFCLPGDDHRNATMISDTLARIPFFKRFVTTNWDPFLERSLDVLIPMIEDRDLAFWDDKKRQVLKIHGCISRPYSIVATEADYNSCVSLNPLIFNKLRDMMATKTFIFLGYSMRDSDFGEIWSSITDRLGTFGRLAYAVNPFATNEDIGYWRERGVAIYKTTDAILLGSLEGRLEKNGEIASSKYLDLLREQRRRIVGIHIRNNQQSSGDLASAMYQDGLLHELDDIFTSIGLGTKRNSDFEADRREAEKIIDTFVKADNIVEIAYWSGRFMAVDWYCDRNEGRIPAYFHPDKLQPLTRLVRGMSFSENPEEPSL